MSYCINDMQTQLIAQHSTQHYSRGIPLKYTKIHKSISPVARDPCLSQAMDKELHRIDTTRNHQAFLL